jgi:haloacetate dehalogenase
MSVARVNDQSIAYDITGAGPPVLLLHGFPQTRAMWRQIVARLAPTYTVVTADLRGYGQSSVAQGVEAMGFRPMGADMLALMDHLGFDAFHLAGHDRGGRTAHRMALDAPDRLRSLCVMDIVPTEWILTNLTTPLARAYYHWLFLAQPEPFPETMIGHDPDAYFESCLLGFGHAHLSDFQTDALADYARAWRDPERINAMCNDYRAAIDIDYPLDQSDLHRTLSLPSLVLFGHDGAMARNLDIGETWQPRLANMQATGVPGGHFFPEQSPKITADHLLTFWARL